MSDEQPETAHPSDGVLSLLGRRLRPRKAIPFVQQLEWADCGAACLTMILGHHGKQVPLAKVREAMGLGRDGVSARLILETARRFGLTGRGVKLEPDDLPQLQRGSVLHWEFSHFVVFDRVTREGVHILDPATGPRVLSLEELAGSFTGIAIELTPAPEFQREKGKGSLSRLRRYARELMGERRVFGRVVVLSLVLRLLALAFPLLTGSIVDQIVPRADQHLLLVVTLAVLIMQAFSSICAVVRSYLLIQLRMVLELRSTFGFLDHLVRLPYQFFQQRSDGDLMMRLRSNGTIREMVTSQSLAALLDGTFVLVYGAIVFAVNVKLGAIVLGLVLLETLIYAVARRGYARYMAENLDRDAKAEGYLVQLLGGIETLKSSGTEQGAVEHYANLHVDGVNVEIKRLALDARVDAMREGIANLAPVTLLVVGAMAVMKGEMSLGTMLAVNSLATSLFGPLSQLIGSALDLQNATSHIDRVDDVLNTSPEQDRNQTRTPHALQGGISLRNLRFRYGENMPYVVDGVSVDIPAGASVAVVGPSGGGKTTLLNLLAGMYRPTEGTVAYDGVSLAELDLEAVRRQIGFVPQHPYVFGSTIRDNILMTCPGADLDQAMAAARAACLHDDVLQMPLGYDTPIADGGGSLSGGQRQRIALARAILRRPRVMFIDEGTSALDNATERKVIHNLSNLRCTRVTIAHRLTTIQNADLILVMQGGKLVEQGTHAELMARRGAYHELVTASGQQGSTQERTNGTESRPRARARALGM